MNEYQTKYLENTKKVMELVEQGENLGSYEGDPYERKIIINRTIRGLMNDNMGMLRSELIPFIDDIHTAGREDIEAMLEFDDELVRTTRGQDNGLHYQINNALIFYARQTADRNLLIRELYQTAMALFNFQNLLGNLAKDDVRWKMRMMFGEAAGYIREYDEIEDVETRGYIHRSMGNLALTYGTDENAKKMEAVNRSLKYLTSPIYHEKTPSLPWNVYIYKTHQERTTFLSAMRNSTITAEQVRDVMESAEYVHNKQLQSAKEKGTSLQSQWLYVYYAASYHCGLNTLSELFERLEEIYISASEEDYSEQGQYANVYIPAVYSSYVNRNPGYLSKKRPIITMMYGRMMRYVKAAPYAVDRELLFRHLRGYMSTFIEYPGSLTFKDYIDELLGEGIPRPMRIL